jgi:hypothetical protein
MDALFSSPCGSRQDEMRTYAGVESLLKTKVTQMEYRVYSKAALCFGHISIRA